MIPDSCEEICPKSFNEWESLLRVTSGESSPLKRMAFRGSGIEEIHIPDSVEELCNKCFYWCKRLSRVTFGECSLLKRRVALEIRQSSIPDNVEELSGKCFTGASVFHALRLASSRH